MNQTAHNDSDQRIIALLRQHDKQGVALAYDKYSAALLGVVFRIVADTEVAEEILQDVFIKIWQRADQYDDTKGRFFTWAMNIARNAAIDYTRVKKHQHKNQELDTAVHSIDQREQLAPNIDTIDIRKLAATLAPEHKSIIDLIYFNGYTQAETAEALQIPLGTVKTRLRAALGQLRKLF